VDWLCVDAVPVRDLVLESGFPGRWVTEVLPIGRHRPAGTPVATFPALKGLNFLLEPFEAVELFSGSEGYRFWKGELMMPQRFTSVRKSLEFAGYLIESRPALDEIKGIGDLSRSKHPSNGLNQAKEVARLLDAISPVMPEPWRTLIRDPFALEHIQLDAH
jgi:hypothetical protein